MNPLRLVVGQLGIERQHRVHFAVALDPGNLVHWLPRRARFSLSSVELLAGEEAEDRERDGVAQVAAVGNGFGKISREKASMISTVSRAMAGILKLRIDDVAGSAV
jgi:hypothetical protein